MRLIDEPMNIASVIVHVQCVEWMQDEGGWEAFPSRRSAPSLPSTRTVGVLIVERRVHIG
jgi:hypothetical protein